MGMSDTVVGAVPMETSGPPSARKQSAHVFALISSVPVARRDRPGSGAILPLAAAGDAFDAGFLYGYLNRWELEISLRLAVVCGALSTQAAGGTTAQPTLDEALANLK